MSDSNDSEDSNNSDDLLPFERGVSRYFVPYGIVKTDLRAALAPITESVKQHARELLQQDWRIYVVEQSRGRCYGSQRVITIPLWCTKRDAGYLTWYMAHEFAHAYDRCKHNHGPEFMEWLKRICPPEFVHHEIGYKPRNAMAAGIVDPNKPKKITYDDLF